ncbi:unnamed protein product [Moneuplotes crassus]|uniref:Palmitoyl-protein thioesterase n=2 Tax=Euplotes crassus TaxID=5936 RepID=A0AAD1XQ43_EUPCR|nr:unnamed protein product [Moneuplotes crassus]
MSPSRIKLSMLLCMLTFIALSYAEDSQVAPILVIHGVTATCNEGRVKSIGEHYNTYSHCYPIGGDDAKTLSVLYNIRVQGKILCHKIHSNENFKDGNFSILAFSQGAIIAKYIIGYCPLKHPVRSFVAFGGPNMGVSYFPHYPADTWIGAISHIIINRLAYWWVAQWFIAPADYWRVPNNPQAFLEGSRFLADATNEINFNQTMKDLWLSLKFARFVKWDDDSVIIPRESSWWGQYTTDYKIISRFDTEVYQKDLVGIRTLEEEGRADFINIPGDHMQVSHEQVNQLTEVAFLK